MKGYFTTTRKLTISKDGTKYLMNETEIKEMLDEILAMAEVDNMELVSTFRTEDNVLYLIFKNK